MLDAIWTLVGRLNRGATDRNRFRFDLPEKSRTLPDWPSPSDETPAKRIDAGDRV
jgi:hypothetical protein